MLLRECLRIEPGDVIAFVGAGGKSSAIARLVSELKETIPVLVTTTTRLAGEQASVAKSHVQTQDPEWILQLRERMTAGGSVLLTAGQGDDGKLISPTNAELETAHAILQEVAGVMLVEADGARGRLVKAPAEHEPAIPAFSTQVVLLAAIDAVGSAMSEEFVHRPEWAGELMGLELGAPITVDSMARLLGDTRGGLKGIPAGATSRCLLTRVQSEGQLKLGREIAGLLLREGGIRSVLMANLKQADPVFEQHGHVAGVVLAAGGSERFGKQKLLEHWRGEALIRHAVRTALRSGLERVVVVVGAQHDEVEQTLTDMPVGIVINERWAEGQAGSVRAGLETIPESVEAVVFLLGDMPLVEPELLRALIYEHRRSLGPIITPVVGDHRANPVLFDHATFSELARIEGDQGGRALYDRFQVHELPWQGSAAADVDTLDDLRQLP